jgi:hypothetical protein
MSDFTFDDCVSKNASFDDYLAESLEGPSVDTIRVATLSQLSDFMRTASGDLVHMSRRDLWSLEKDDQGQFVISRKFDAQGAPLKG